MGSSDISVLENLPTLPTPLDNGDLVSAVLRYDPNTIPENMVLDTYQIDFATFQVWDSVIGEQSAQAAIEKYEQNGEIVIAYATYVATVFEITIPNQICIGDWCWTPPGAGHIIESSKMWRYWFLTAKVGGAMAAKPQSKALAAPLGPAALIIIVVGALAGVVVMIGAIQVLNGQMSWKDLKAGVTEIFKIPGQNISAPVQAAAWPFFALGIAMVGGALVLPAISASTAVKVPVGRGGSVTVSGSASGGTKR